MKAPELESERLIFKALSLKHLSQEYVSWLNDVEVYRFLETGGDYSLQKLECFLKELEENEILFWAVHVKSSNLHIGNIKIDPINWKHGFAEYGILMGRKSEWGKGYASEASKKIIDYCFGELGLRKITLGVIADNVPAVRLYQKLGFQTEGVYKNHVLNNNKYADVIRMAIFNKM